MTTEREYCAVITKKGKKIHVEFPDIPGVTASSENKLKAIELSTTMIQNWIDNAPRTYLKAMPRGVDELAKWYRNKPVELVPIKVLCK